MGKAIVTRLTLDDEVADLLSRVGAEPNILNYIAGYDVSRKVAGPTLVTVTLYADAEFSKVAAKESENV